MTVVAAAVAVLRTVAPEVTAIAQAELIAEAGNFWRAEGVAAA
jgi:hypothetical protein